MDRPNKTQSFAEEKMQQRKTCLEILESCVLRWEGEIGHPNLSTPLRDVSCKKTTDVTITLVTCLVRKHQIKVSSSMGEIHGKIGNRQAHPPKEQSVTEGFLVKLVDLIFTLILNIAFTQALEKKPRSQLFFATLFHPVFYATPRIPHPGPSWFQVKTQTPRDFSPRCGWIHQPTNQPTNHPTNQPTQQNPWVSAPCG